MIGIASILVLSVSIALAGTGVGFFVASAHKLAQFKKAVALLPPREDAPGARHGSYSIIFSEEEIPTEKDAFDAARTVAMSTDRIRKLVRSSSSKKN